MQRVLVIGISGAGKSTFARKLAPLVGLPLIHLDKEFWRPGWRLTPRVEWWERVAELAAGERWLMEGNYANSLHLRLPRADTVLWFDYPTVRCLGRVLKRVATAMARCGPTWRPVAPSASTGSSCAMSGGSTGSSGPRS